MFKKSFSFVELTSNADNKTSGSGTCGVLICIVGIITFAWAAFAKQSETINQSVIVISVGAGLLGYRKSQESKKEETQQKPEEESSGTNQD